MKKIQVNCKGSHELGLDELDIFQEADGFKLKELSNESRNKLKKSLIDKGFWFPFFFWHEKETGKNFFIDGTQRDKVLLSMQGEYALPDKFPCAEIFASSRKEAAEAILLQSSAYGEVTFDGLKGLIEKYELDLDSLKDKLQIPEISLDKFENSFKYKDKDADAVPEVPETPKTKRGDIYELPAACGGWHRVMCGDSTKAEDMGRLMNDQKADMVFTDPPYGVDYAAKNDFLNAADKGNSIQTDIQNDVTAEDAFKLWEKVFTILPNFLSDKHSIYVCSPQTRDLMMMMMIYKKGGFTLEAS